MANISRKKAERITWHVLNCKINRLTAIETAEYLKIMKLPVSVRTVKRYRAKIIWRMLRYDLQNPNADHTNPPPIDVLLSD
jgi:hypothetical protein